MLAAESILEAIWSAQRLWVDVAIIGLFCFFHIGAWMGVSRPTDLSDDAAENASTAFGAGLTVAGILIPASLLSIQLGFTNDTVFPESAAVDMLVAAIWSLVSVIFGIYGLYVISIRGDSAVYGKDVGISYGIQLVFILTAIVRITWAIWSTADGIVGNLGGT